MPSVRPHGQVQRILFTLILWGTARTALACGVCAASIADSFAPPVGWWITIAFTWFLSMGVIRTVTKAKLPAQPGLLGSLGLALVAAVVASAAVGPLVVPFLLIPPLGAAFMAFGSEPFPGRRAVRIVAVLHLVAIAVGLVQTVHILATRSEGEFIIQWEHAAMGEARFHQLRQEEPQSLATYRYLVEHGSPRLAASSAERIAVLGSAEIDGPLLERARWRAADSLEASETIAAALAELQKKPLRSPPRPQ